MISLILYGRNDAHGYNLHRRAALSLNCLAEVLTDPDDEIVFVDYNTPDELPTFVEALADTLTERCVHRLRVLRVPASLHHERFGDLTHLPTVEAVARNAAVRRANPANRWLLSTNSDMVIFPFEGGSLSDVCRDLDDGFYGLPRFELPEWLWEQLPRSDPSRAISDLRRLGPGLRLDEHTLSHEWIRFEAPGDFQLCLREDFAAIDGFNEEMLLGWHVDSNLSRRMMLHGRPTESLDAKLAGYHCNHNRTATVHHEAIGIANDLVRFFTEVESAELPAQRTTWGLADVVVEEVSLGDPAAQRLTDALLEVISAAETPRSVSSAKEWLFELTYDAAHVLPFIADTIVVAPHDTTIGYLGANVPLNTMLGRLVEELDRSMTLLSAADKASAEAMSLSADVLVVDFGLDSTAAWDERVGPLDRHGSGRYPAQLRAVLEAFQRIVEIERARLRDGAHPRPFVLVNSSTLYTDAYVKAHFDCSYTTPHSRIRRATVKLAPTGDEATMAALASEQRLLRWAERDKAGAVPLRLDVDDRIEIAALEDFSAFGEGWLFPEASAIWTHGSRAQLAFALDGLGRGAYLFTIFIGRVGAARDEALEVELKLDGVRVDTRRFAGGGHSSAWRVRVPDEAVARRMLDLELDIREPRVWAQDERQLGLYVKGFLLQRDGWGRRLADAVATLRRRGAPA